MSSKRAQREQRNRARVSEISFFLFSLFISALRRLSFSATNEEEGEENRFPLFSPLFPLNNPRFLSSCQLMEDKENAVETMTADMHQQQQQQQRGSSVKAANGGGASATLPLMHSKPAAPATATVAATPRSIGGAARVAHFAATPIGQRNAGDASSVRKGGERREKDNRRNLAVSIEPSSSSSSFSNMRLVLPSKGARFESL